MSQSKLEKILDDLYSCGVARGKGLIYVYNPQDVARSAILELFKSAVPDEKEVASWADPVEGTRRVGFNDCRTETLRNMELI